MKAIVSLLLLGLQPKAVHFQANVEPHREKEDLDEWEIRPVVEDEETSILEFLLDITLL